MAIEGRPSSSTPGTISISVHPTHSARFNPSDTEQDRDDPANAAPGYKTREIASIADFAAVVKSGKTWSSSVYKQGYRLGENFIGSDTIAVEFDHVKPGVDDWETLAPTSSAFAAILSPSYFTGFKGGKKVKPIGGYRLVFRLDRTVTDRTEYQKVVLQIQHIVGLSGGVFDEACKDAARFWYGAKDAEILWSSQENWDSPLPVNALLEAYNDREKSMGKKTIQKRESTPTVGGGDRSKSVPLTVCLSLESRESIKRGAGEGGRDNAGIALAKDLIGLTQYLDSIEQAYTEDPDELFQQFCDRCDPPFDGGKNMESAAKSSNGPTLSVEAIKNNIRAYQAQTSAALRMGTPSLQASYSRPSELSEELDTIDPDEERAEYQKLSELREPIPNVWSHIAPALPPEWQRAIEEEHRIWKKPHEVYAAVLATAISQPLGAKVKVAISKRELTNLNLYTAVVGVAGSAKTQILKLFIKAHSEQQKIQDAEHEQAVKDYKRVIAARKADKGNIDPNSDEPDAPVKKRILTTGGTIEAMQRSMSQNESKHYLGIFRYPGELNAFHGSLNKYNTGGDDIANVMNIWDGAEIQKETMSGEDISVYDTHLSIIGTIQPDVWAADMVKLNKNGCGYAGRWLLSYIPGSASSYDDDDDGELIQSEVQTLYDKLLADVLGNFSCDVIKVAPEAKATSKEIKSWFKTNQEQHEGDKSTMNLLIKGRVMVYKIAGAFAAVHNPPARETWIQSEHLIAAYCLVRQSIRNHLMLCPSGDTHYKSAEAVLTKAYSIVTAGRTNKKGVLQLRDLVRARLGDVSDRPKILEKLSQLHGGNIVPTKRGNPEWHFPICVTKK